MKLIERSALSDRLCEVLEEFSEANTITVRQVLDALVYTYACVQRNSDDTPADKLH